MSAITQDNRLIRLDTPLGTDKLILTAFSGSDIISGLSTYNLEAITSEHQIQPDTLVGKAVTVTIDETRFFHGFISQLSIGNVLEGGLQQYRMEMVPWLWFLTHTSDCRIFQNLTVTDILQDVFAKSSFTDFDVSGLTDTYEPLEYCVQFGESDFNFVSRLMEKFGISYFFKHEEDKHTLILVDNNKAFIPSEEPQLGYSRTPIPNKNHLFQWEREFTFHSGQHTLNSYNFEQPGSNLISEAPSVITMPGMNKFEHYQFSGKYADISTGAKAAQRLMEADETRHEVIQAASNSPSLHSGAVFELTQHEISEHEGDYLIISAYHQATESNYIDDSQGPSYSNQISCIPEAITYKPTQNTIRPRMSGPQTALVVGPAGDEIYTDEYNRIKVQFHWDRVGQKDDASSCWLRISNMWAGKKWGSFFIPRIGQEVIVDFIDGDPDQPMVTGAVYNADNQPPYPVANKTQSGIKTHSSKDAPATKYNELRFEDKMDAEEIYIQAEKDFNRLVKNNEFGEVQNDQELLVKMNRTITIAEGNESKTIAQGNQVVNIDTGDQTLEIASGDQNITLGAGNRTSDISQTDETTADTINLTATTGINIKVGGSSISITPSGIDIKSTQIKIDGTMVEAKGSAMVTIKGGLTKIN